MSSAKERSHMSPTEATQSPAVLIVGAGPTGLIAALALAKNGISVRVIERNKTFEPRTRGAALVPRTMELFANLGVVEEFIENGLLVPTLRTYAPNGYDVLSSWTFLAYEEPTPDVPYSRVILHPQDRTEAVLRNALKSYGIQVELGAELVKFEQDDEGVTAHVAFHGSTTPEVIRASWLIGADGGRSSVRKGLGIPFHGETPQAVSTILAGFDMESFDRTTWHRWGDLETASIVISPSVPAPRFNMVMSGKQVDESLLGAGVAALQDVFNQVTKRDDIKITKIDSMTSWKPNIRMAERFASGRIFLAGDAAHTHPPTGGQGLNSSAQDAHNLAWKLALVHKGLAPPSLLSTYEAERMPVITEMIDVTTGMYRLMWGKNSILSAASQSQDQAAPAPAPASAPSSTPSPWKRDMKLNMIGVNCRWSPIVVDERTAIVEGEHIEAYGTPGGTLRAGDRAPDAPSLIDLSSGESTTLFKTFGPSYHTALIFSSRDFAIESTILDTLDSYNTVAPGDACLVLPVFILSPGFRSGETRSTGAGAAHKKLVDSDGHAGRSYQMREDEDGIWIVIVRPDGVIGAIVKGKEGIEKYFSGIFVASK
ncbi:hypothetical protein BOTBODRAFT_141286 [Botryobasidium botryosum FD-172 SS1]|uniref:FAD-binding domain-containing protein n=1 Tax=Botryobasidium botryosum (strain FD-172 SS1) TaxID=930990 RepID=A0A067M2K9_BOTB1|nr:hypothetical protein BOTBODRAFT_141286 [Botryobasidium botryosum FD-172 SS1]